MKPNDHDHTQYVAIQPLSEWQKQELDRRYEEYKAGKIVLYDWRDVHDKLRRRNQP